MKIRIKNKKQGKNDIEWSNPCGDQTTHFNLTALEVLMLKTFALIVKKQEPHLMEDLLYAYHLPTKGKHK
jgi:hypothetical protein